MSTCRGCGRQCVCAPIEPCACGDICEACAKGARAERSRIVEFLYARAAVDWRPGNADNTVSYALQEAAKVLPAVPDDAAFSQIECPHCESGDATSAAYNDGQPAWQCRACERLFPRNEPLKYKLGADGRPVCSECSTPACEFLRIPIGTQGVRLTQRCYDHRLDMPWDEVTGGHDG